MFIVDALIGNTDRHNSDWGFLVNEKTNEISIAPVYDCGSSFVPTLSDQGIAFILKNPSELKNVSYNVFSCLKENNKRIHYVDYLKSLKNEDCNNALCKIFPKINLNEIGRIIDTMPISKIRKEFYKQFLHIRYSFLKEAYDKLKKARD